MQPPPGTYADYDPDGLMDEDMEDFDGMELDALDNSDDEDYAEFDAEELGADGEAPLEDEDDEEDPGVDEEGIERLGEKEYLA